jgi:hypothetical protein
LLEKIARDKNSCLIRKSVNHGQKKFYNIGPSPGLEEESWPGKYFFIPKKNIIKKAVLTIFYQSEFFS